MLEKDENFDNLWLFKLTCVLNNQNQRSFFSLSFPHLLSFSYRRYSFRKIVYMYIFQAPRFSSTLIMCVVVRLFVRALFAILPLFASFRIAFPKTVTGTTTTATTAVRKHNIAVGKVTCFTHTLQLAHHEAYIVNIHTMLGRQRNNGRGTKQPTFQ